MEGKKITFGKVLREKRMARGLTQKELAELARVDDSYISQLERDYKFPSARTIESLAQALGVEVAELLAMYFPGPEAKAPAVFVGREREAAAFEQCLSADVDVLVVTGAPGSGKTALINEKFVPACREGRVPYIYFDSRRLTSYRTFLKDLRDAFASRRGGYRSFDEIYEQCEAIEGRLRGRFQDPFSLHVAGAGAEAAGPGRAELTYAEKYMYREAEKLLTEEFLAGWRAAGSKDGRRNVVFLDDFHDVGATVGYWIGAFIERLHEAASQGRKLMLVLTVRPGRPPSLPAAAKVKTLTLGSFSPGEGEEYFHARDLDLADADWEIVKSLEGDVRAISFWADYFEAAADYGRNRLGRAEEALRRLDGELTPFAAGDDLPGGARLRIYVRRLLGHLTRLQGRLAEAADYYGSAVVLAEEEAEGGSADLGYLYLDLGHVCRHQGRWDRAVDYYVLANEEFAAHGEELGAGVAHSSLGTTFRLRREFTRAKQEYKQAAAVLGALTDRPAARPWLASTLSNHAITRRLEAEELMRAGEEASARRALAQAKTLCQEALEASDDAAETAVAENRFGLCLFAESRWTGDAGAAEEAADLLSEATRRHKRALAVFEDLGDQYRVAQVLADLGVAAAQQGLVHDAIINFKNSLAIFQQMGSQYHMAMVLVELGLLSEGGEQLSYFAEALGAARNHNDDSLAEVASAVKEALEAGDGRRAGRFFEEQVAAEPKLEQYFGRGR
jgi:transcriptional regulator with XRE-family HTH domain